MVAILTNIVLKNPHLRLVKRAKAAINPKTPNNINITKSIRDVVYEIETSKNCPIPAGPPNIAKESLPID